MQSSLSWDSSPAAAVWAEMSEGSRDPSGLKVGASLPGEAVVRLPFERLLEEKKRSAPACLTKELLLAGSVDTSLSLERALLSCATPSRIFAASLRDCPQWL